MVKQTQMPSVGRIVHYRTTTPNGTSVIRPAIIIKVWHEIVVNLHVFLDPSDVEYPAQAPTKVAYSSEFDDSSEAAAGTWFWPPRV